jgi:hypothetical protein
MSAPLLSLKGLHNRATRLHRRTAITRRLSREIVAQKAGYASYAAAVAKLPLTAAPERDWQPDPKSLRSIRHVAGHLVRRDGLLRTAALDRVARMAGYADFSDAARQLEGSAR